MQKILAIILAISTTSAVASGISTSEYSKLFKSYDACFILYNLNTHKIVSEYNPHNRCNERISPDSTFKIPLSLMAFNQGIINQNTVFKWNGEKGVIPEHEKDHTAASWLKDSVVWVSQRLTPKLGYARIQHYLADFHYGNQDFSGDEGKNNGITHAWLSSSLKISANEQLHFLNAMLTNKLSISKEATNQTMQNLYQGKLDNGADYYGKTGSGRHGNSQLRDGWFVGFIKQGSQQYAFVSNLTDKSINNSDPSSKLFGSQLLKQITLTVLNKYFS